MEEPLFPRREYWQDGWQPRGSGYSRHWGHHEDDDEYDACHFSPGASFLRCFVGAGMGLRCCFAFLSTFFLAGGLWMGITRNLYCNPDSLAGIAAPYDGQMMPLNFTLYERRNVFQLTKLVDVYDGDKYLGYFYDINLLILMRFGFSDAEGRIWFEARYASFLSRFKPVAEYILQRCDAAPGGPLDVSFHVREDFWQEMATSPLCLFSCARFFDVAKGRSAFQDSESLLPNAAYGKNEIAKVLFNSTRALQMNGQGSIIMRQRWWMEFRDNNGTELGSAHQRFTNGGPLAALRILSRWSVGMTGDDHRIPNWVIGFMAVLADIEEDTGIHNSD